MNDRCICTTFPSCNYMQFSNYEGSPLPVIYDQIVTKDSLFVRPCIVKNDITQHTKLQSCCRDTEARTSHIKPNHHGTQMGLGIKVNRVTYLS